MKKKLNLQAVGCGELWSLLFLYVTEVRIENDVFN